MKTSDINLLQTEIFPATEHLFTASHVPVSPIDFDFRTLRQQVHAIKLMVDMIEDSLQGGEPALFDMVPAMTRSPHRNCAPILLRSARWQS